MNLKECRDRIDTIDEMITELLNQRMDVVREVAVNKAMDGLATFDRAREEEKLAKIKELSHMGYEESICQIFKTIMDESKGFQEEHKVEFGLLGRNLAHSFSPQIHKVLGGYEYGLFQIEPEDLGEFFNKANFKGINVTTPYKKEAIRYCGKLSDIARRIGSVNTIISEEDGAFSGYNTDYYGFSIMLKNAIDDLGEDIKKEKALILGNGGVAPTVKAVLEDEGFENIVVISRRGEDNYDNLHKHFDAKLIVNTTPVGMYPANGAAPIEIGQFKETKLVLDLIYNPFKSKLVLEAENAGIMARGGFEMLVYQAAKAMELFTGKEISQSKCALACQGLESDYKNIVIIGMPGAGKTTKGKEMSQRLGRKFVDIDDEIYSRTGKTPEEIILFEGAEKFREIESQVTRDVCAGHGQIIATGGGVVTRAENRMYLEENSVIIYLKRDLEDLETANRPLSKEKGVREIFEERAALYEEWCDLEIESDEEKR